MIEVYMGVEGEGGKREILRILEYENERERENIGCKA